MPDIVCINKICTLISVDSPTAGSCAVMDRSDDINITISGCCFI